MEGFITVREAAAKWGISTRAVTKYCSESRIEGAELFNNSWAIPVNAEKPDDARARKDFKTEGTVKPIIKWAGGKGQLLDEIRNSYPKGLGTEIVKYAEPFIGGAAVLFDVLGRYDFEEAYISDVNRELVHLYMTVRDAPNELIELLSDLQKEHILRSTDERKDYFYQNRERFNQIKAENDIDWIECSALFIYLNKTCFNGLYRVNSKGEFNVPSGVYKNPRICDDSNIRKASGLLQGVRIEHADYLKSSDFVDERTFAYFDPPYRPLNDTSSFTSYAEGQFNDDDQRRLAQYVHELNQRGAKVMVSNSDPKNSDPNDEFFDELYAGLNIRRVSATRMINSKGDSRGPVNELLITNYLTSGHIRIDDLAKFSRRGNR